MALSAYDQAVYDAGYKYIPQSQYLLNPFEIPTTQAAAPTISGGLTTIPVSMGGEDNSNPYRLTGDIRTDYNPFPARQAAERYSRTFNPQPVNPGLTFDQQAYNLATQALAAGVDPNTQGFASFTGGTLEGLRDIANERIMDARQTYGAQGQYVDPYDSVTETEANKLMDMYPEYYGINRREIELPGILGVGQDFLKSVIPINQRAIMENEARGAGIFTDDIGRIVGDPSTAGGIMAGYNLNKIDAGTFDKRRDAIMEGLMKTNPELAKQRLALLDEAEEDILGARKTTQQIYKMRKDKKAADKKRKEDEAAAAAEEKRRADAAEKVRLKNLQKKLDQQGSGGGGTTTSFGTTTTPYGGGAGGVQSNFGGGGGFAGKGSGASGPAGGQSSRGNYGGGRGGYGGYGGGADARRFMDGGLADLVDIYD